MMLNGSQILMETLLEQGTDTVFGYPGGAVLNIYDALYDYSDRINHVLTAHEQAAAHAADGYARTTGKTGVCLATSGPGATNLVTGIATAYMDSIPMVAITGNVSSNLLGKDSFQEVYITGITMPITKHNYVVRDVSKLADTIRDAFRIANTGRKGPVLIDLPKDVTAANAEFERKPLRPQTMPGLHENLDLSEIADLINESKCPVMLYGGGVVSSNAAHELKQLIKKISLPCCHTVMAVGVLPADDKLNLGLIGMHGTVPSMVAVNRSDLLIAVGSRFSDRVATNTSKFARKPKIIHIDIDPAEINKNVQIDYSLVGDVKDVLTQLLPIIKENKRHEWLEEIEDLKSKLFKEDDKSGDSLAPAKVIDAIYSSFEEDLIVTTDVGQHQMWASQYSRATDPRNFLTSGGLGTMGYGYGAAIGASVARPENQVVHITGDGSFHMNLNELCTAVSYKLPIITVVFNNSVLGMVYQWQRSFYNSRFSFTDPKRQTDFVKLAEAFGASGFRCNSINELKSALKEAVKIKGPVVIDVPIDRDERVLPMIPAGLSIDEAILD